MTLDRSASKVFCPIFVEEYLRLLLLLHLVNIMCEMLLSIMTLVVQVRDEPYPITKKSLGSGQKIKKEAGRLVSVIIAFISTFC